MVGITAANIDAPPLILPVSPSFSLQSCDVSVSLATDQSATTAKGVPVDGEQLAAGTTIDCTPDEGEPPGPLPGESGVAGGPVRVVTTDAALDHVRLVVTQNKE